uniref:Uncharacterized protein n=1 Tax=Anguilla anguilla TaxID=7936 RepID=A0A0E9WRZ8_ANGAN
MWMRFRWGTLIARVLLFQGITSDHYCMAKGKARVCVEES